MDHATTTADRSTDKRRHPRYRLDAPYTFVRIRLPGQRHFELTGHAYDVSRGGLRFELDDALPAGQRIDMELTLPKLGRTPLRARGRVVRLHDPDELGPIRMGAVFTTMRSSADQRRLDRYLARQSPAGEAA